MRPIHIARLDKVGVLFDHQEQRLSEAVQAAFDLD
jgi:hypothetical protein